MANSINLLGTNFDVEIIRKSTIKHIYLKLKHPYKIELRTNKWVSDEYLFNFIEKKSSWIIKHHEEYQKKDAILNDETKILFLGKLYEKDDLLKDKIDIEEFYKNEAKRLITPIVEKYSYFMNLHPRQLKFRKNKSRWGSCSMKNNINLNTELIKHDLKFIEYVVVHELAHIKHKNHQKEFWELVGQYMPDFKQRRKLYKLSD